MFNPFRNLTPFGLTTFIVDTMRILVSIVFIVQLPTYDAVTDPLMPSIVYIRAGVLCLIIFAIMTPALVRMLVVGYRVQVV
jgi:hypothetical protein